MPTPVETSVTLECQRCHYTWHPAVKLIPAMGQSKPRRSWEYPKKCSSCGSVNWQLPHQRKVQMPPVGRY